MSVLDDMAIAISGAPFPSAKSKAKARSALNAMRTPTPAVIEAMRREIGPLGIMWTAAIDAILSEEGE